MTNAVLTMDNFHVPLNYLDIWFLYRILNCKFTDFILFHRSTEMNEGKLRRFQSRKREENCCVRRLLLSSRSRHRFMSLRSECMSRRDDPEEIGYTKLATTIHHRRSIFPFRWYVFPEEYLSSFGKLDWGNRENPTFVSRRSIEVFLIVSQ